MNITQDGNNVQLEITSEEALELAQALIAQVAREQKFGHAIVHSRGAIVHVGGRPAPGVLVINVAKSP